MTRNQTNKKKDWRDWIDAFIGWPLAIIILLIIIVAALFNLVYLWKEWLVILAVGGIVYYILYKGHKIKDENQARYRLRRYASITRHRVETAQFTEKELDRLLKKSDRS